MRTPKRSLDVRRIRQSRCYTIQELSSLLGITKGTVRAWLKLGLAKLDDVKPFLIPGDALKNWLTARRQSRRQRCQPHELFCCRCRKPRQAKPWSVEIKLRNAKTITICGLCEVCGAKMNRGGSVARLQEIKETFQPHTLVEVSLEGCEEPTVNHHSEGEPEE